MLFHITDSGLKSKTYLVTNFFFEFFNVTSEERSPKLSSSFVDKTFVEPLKLNRAKINKKKKNLFSGLSLK